MPSAVAPTGKAPKKRQRKSKARTTEVSSSSSSSESESAEEVTKKKTKSAKKESVKSKAARPEQPQQLQPEQAEEPLSSFESTEVTPAAEPALDVPTKPFTQTYLRLLTAQFSNDLDSLRRAADFKESSSVAILVNALKQGENLFTTVEKEIVLGGERVSGVQ